jgi:hypothetical protein
MKTQVPPQVRFRNGVHHIIAFAIVLLTCFSSSEVVKAQDTLTGAFEGIISDSQSGNALEGATVEIINQQTGRNIQRTTDARGRFFEGQLAPGLYTIRVGMKGYQTRELIKRLEITYPGEVVPVPVTLDPVTAAAAAVPTPAPIAEADTAVRASMIRIDGRRSGSFHEEQVSTLPIGSLTLVRSFDELALLLPGVAPPPQTLGNVAGPGVGPGVGSAGQFSVNGLRSRANNFTVDGSDNNDEDIGVRRQGFVALIPQPIESIKEYQVITLLAPAQFGRNIGAQVNAVSKSGGNEMHGTFYGFLNTSQLNAPRFFDTNSGNGVVALTAGNNQPVLLCPTKNQTCIVNGVTSVAGGSRISVRNQSGGEDSFTFGQAGGVIGGPLVLDRLFYFFSVEGQLINATREESFAVPTVDQRGFNNTGATGIFQNPSPAAGNAVIAFPTTGRGDAVFALYPFVNNPGGVYGANTFTQVLPASAQGKVLSARFEDLERIRGRHQWINARYNFTDDWRDIPSVGGALFSSIRSRVRAQNFSFWTNSELNSPASGSQILNQLRLSYGRTRLNFQENRDQLFQLRSDSLPNTPFLLNAPLILNTTLPRASGAQFLPNIGPVTYSTDPSSLHTESALGPVGQVRLAGFSPLGVDVFNFPQQRVNNTYQVADELKIRRGSHSIVFGADVRRTELNSLLPRNARSLLTFTGVPQVSGAFDFQTHQFSNLAFTGKFIPAVSFAAVEGSSGFTQVLASGGESAIDLRFYQYNFYGQDQWRVGDNLSINFGLRYEYNTPPRETSGKIENTFNDPSLALIPGLRTFIGDRTQIFEPDRNNFAPRIGVAYSPSFFGPNRTTVFRGGYGIFYDQMLGAVISQSRNVYPTYLTIDLAGGSLPNLSFTGAGRNPSNGPCRAQSDGTGGTIFVNCFPFQLTNPQLSTLKSVPVVQPRTLNTLNPNISFSELVQLFSQFGTGGGQFPAESSFGFTIPTQQMPMPMAHHYDFTFEQQLRRDLVVSAAYVGTLGRHLLRTTTPNLGQDAFVAPLFFTANVFSEFGLSPYFLGLSLPPGTRIASSGNGFVGGRPVKGVGTVTEYETTANSRYDSLQIQARGRFHRYLQYQIAYTLSKVTDDVSDVFDLAGASALPQNSFKLTAESGPANFDTRHRFVYNFIYDFSHRDSQGGGFRRALFDGLQFAGTGQFQTGQPFTVNSIFDVNLDGNLTDRLNNTDGIEVTGDRSRPLRLTTTNTASMLAPVGQDGKVGRNTFRAGNFLDLNLAVIKNFAITSTQKLIVRVDAFNFINRANFGVPVRFLEAPGFGKATDTVMPGRRIQFGLKYAF